MSFQLKYVHKLLTWYYLGANIRYPHHSNNLTFTRTLGSLLYLVIARFYNTQHLKYLKPAMLYVSDRSDQTHGLAMGSSVLWGNHPRAAW